MVESTLGLVQAPLEISFIMLSGHNVINSEENDQQISPASLSLSEYQWNI